MKSCLLKPFLLAGSLSTNVDACIAGSWYSRAANRILTRDLRKELFVSTSQPEVIVASDSRSKQLSTIALQVHWGSSSCWGRWSFISSSIGSTVSHNTDLYIAKIHIKLFKVAFFKISYLFNSTFIGTPPDLDETIIPPVGTP